MGARDSVDAALDLSVGRWGNSLAVRLPAELDMTHCLDIREDDFLHAAKLCRGTTSGLRAADAPHLAVALRHGCTLLASLDVTMNTSARRIGMKLVNFS